MSRALGLRRVRWALGVCFVLATASWLATPWYVRAKVLPDLWARYGLTMAAERQDLSIASGAADLHGVRFLDGNEEVLTAKRMEVRISLRGLYQGRTIVERLVFDDPVLHARIEADGHTNVGKIFERPKTNPQATKRPATLWEEVFVHRGIVECDDRARGAKLRIVDFEAAVLDMQTGSGESQDRFGQISIDANLEQPRNKPAPLAIVHWTASAERTEPNFIAHAALTGIDIDSFPAYVDAAQRASLGVDHLDLVVSMDVREGIIRRGAAVATSPERKRPLTLLFGGPFDDPVLERSSELIALWELPFSRLGHVGDVAWDTGSAVVGGAVGVVQGLVRGDPFGAGGAAVEGLGGGIQALASDARDAVEGIGRSLGLVAQEEPRDVKALHAHQRALFLAARREAAQTWSSAHPVAIRDEEWAAMPSMSAPRSPGRPEVVGPYSVPRNAALRHPVPRRERN
jgi:hypothetical protein